MNQIVYFFVSFQVLEEIKKILPCPPEVEDIVVDFEAAIWNAAKTLFPESHVHGCTFHWSQAIYRQVSSLGMSTAYKQHGAVYNYIKQILALPYLPRRHIRPAFDELKEQADNAPEMQEFVSYVERTWFESTVWAVENWCGYRRLVRTNNDTEGWHRRLNQRSGRENLPLYVLLELLLKESKLVDLTLQLVAEHRLSSTRRKQSRDNQERLHQLWGDYEEKKISTKQFLSACKTVLPF